MDRLTDRARDDLKSVEGTYNTNTTTTILPRMHFPIAQIELLNYSCTISYRNRKQNLHVDGLDCQESSTCSIFPDVLKTRRKHILFPVSCHEKIGGGSGFYFIFHLFSSPVQKYK